MSVKLPNLTKVLSFTGMRSCSTAGVAGVALYASSIASGNPLWSKTLVGVTLFGSILTINPFGDVHGQMVMDAFGPLAGNNVVAFSNQDMLAASFLIVKVSDCSQYKVPFSTEPISFSSIIVHRPTTTV